MAGKMERGRRAMPAVGAAFPGGPPLELGFENGDSVRDVAAAEQFEGERDGGASHADTRRSMYAVSVSTTAPKTGLRPSSRTSSARASARSA